MITKYSSFKQNNPPKNPKEKTLPKPMTTVHVKEADHKNQTQKPATKIEK
ncbi:MAG: hypothetical protein JW908_00760 [Anaerolineales bacterium]|nr:hypothetical protein [Anaerolineales bacterium]